MKLQHTTFGDGRLRLHCQSRSLQDILLGVQTEDGLLVDQSKTAADAIPEAQGWPLVKLGGGISIVAAKMRRRELAGLAGPATTV